MKDRNNQEMHKIKNGRMEILKEMNKIKHIMEESSLVHIFINQGQSNINNI